MILAAFHLAARRDRSTHQKQEPSDGYVSISCDVAKCRQSALGPNAAAVQNNRQSRNLSFRLADVRRGFILGQTNPRAVTSEM